VGLLLWESDRGLRGPTVISDDLSDRRLPGPGLQQRFRLLKSLKGLRSDRSPRTTILREQRMKKSVVHALVVAITAWCNVWNSIPSHGQIPQAAQRRKLSTLVKPNGHRSPSAQEKTKQVEHPRHENERVSRGYPRPPKGLDA